MRRRLEWTLIVCALALTTCLCLLILSIRADVVWLPQHCTRFTGAVFGEVQQARVTIQQLPSQIIPPTLGLLDQHATDISRRAQSELHMALWNADSRVGQALGEIQSIHADLRPLLASATQATGSVSTLAATYSALPDRLSTTLAPSWLAIEPEITCRQADGSGYGGCWHSRISGLMGEAVRVGGVFTQQFPTLVTTFQQTNTQVAGISTDVHSFTSKFVAPRSTKQKIWDGIKTAGYVGARFIPAP